jgi:O-antigen/teichoic acid export membrane protein
LLIAGILTLRAFLYSYCRLNTGLLKALDKTSQIARIQSAHFLLLCCAIVYVFFSEKNLAYLLLCLLTAQGAEFLMSLRLLRQLGARFVRVTARRCWELARRSTPIGATYTLSTVMLRGDVLILSLLASGAGVGAFVAADTGLVMIYVIAWLFSGVLLVDLASFASSPAEFDARFRKCIAAILALCIPAAAVALLLAPSAVRLLFGSKFGAAGLPAAIMCVAIPFVFLNAAFLSRAVARQSASTCLTVYGAGAGLSLILNLLLGWRYEGTGIAVSIVLREMAITFAFLRLRNLPAKMGQPSLPLKPGSEFVEVLNT